MSLRSTSRKSCGIEPQSEHSGLPSISIAVKALNEEAKIGRCIESAIEALREVPNPSEIVLADSGSADRTVEIARRYPITIVQLANVGERGCGTGVQLSYQHTRGDYVMLLDGDMELLPGFLGQALAKLDNEPQLAGVAGLMSDTSINNEFDRKRRASGESNTPLRPAPWLNGGGVYRRKAIDEVGGYAANRNLKAWEEADLGMRLTSAGWLLERIAIHATQHTGHAASTFAVLGAMWRSGRARAPGVLIRQSIGNPWWLRALVIMRHPLLIVALWIGALGALGAGISSGHWVWAAAYALGIIVFVILLAIYKRSLVRAIVSLGIWHFMAVGLLIGLCERVVSPHERIASIDLTSRATNAVSSNESSPSTIS